MKKISIIIVNGIISFSAMSQTKYVTKSTSECVRYIKSLGQNIDTMDFFKTTPSSAGLIYKLKNSEIVLIPSDFDSEYPGFIFKDEKELNKMIRDDFFPIGKTYMTVWELEREKLAKLPSSVDYFKDFLFSELNFFAALKNYESFRVLYDKVAKRIKEKIKLETKEKIMISFSILFMNYLVENSSYKWSLETRYERYNSYKYPILSSKKESKNIIDLVFISLEGESSSFDFFLESMNE